MILLMYLFGEISQHLLLQIHLLSGELQIFSQINCFKYTRKPEISTKKKKINFRML